MGLHDEDLHDEGLHDEGCTLTSKVQPLIMKLSGIAGSLTVGLIDILG